MMAGIEVGDDRVAVPKNGIGPVGRSVRSCLDQRDTQAGIG